MGTFCVVVVIGSLIGVALLGRKVFFGLVGITGLYIMFHGGN